MNELAPELHAQVSTPSERSQQQLQQLLELLEKCFGGSDQLHWILGHWSSSLLNPWQQRNSVLVLRGRVEHQGLFQFITKYAIMLPDYKFYYGRDGNTGNQGQTSSSGAHNPNSFIENFHGTMSQTISFMSTYEDADGNQWCRMWPGKYEINKYFEECQLEPQRGKKRLPMHITLFMRERQLLEQSEQDHLYLTLNCNSLSQTRPSGRGKEAKVTPVLRLTRMLGYLFHIYLLREVPQEWREMSFDTQTLPLHTTPIGKCQLYRYRQQVIEGQHQLPSKIVKFKDEIPYVALHYLYRNYFAWCQDNAIMCDSLKVFTSRVPHRLMEFEDQDGIHRMPAVELTPGSQWPRPSSGRRY